MRGEGSRTATLLESALGGAEAQKMDLLAAVARALLASRAGGEAGEKSLAAKT